MKVSGTGAASGAGSAQRAGKPAAGGFAPQAGASAREAAAAGATSNVSALGSLDALLALQETLTPMERRKRAIRRGGGLLDQLDQIKLTLLEDGDPRHALDRLRAMSREARDGTEDSALDGVLDEIDLRAEVELAKDEMLRRSQAVAA